MRDFTQQGRENVEARAWSPFWLDGIPGWSDKNEELWKAQINQPLTTMGLFGKFFGKMKGDWSRSPTPKEDLCPKHKAPLQEGECKIRYGSLAFADGYFQARETLFPYSRLFRVGGCCYSEDFPKTESTRYCSECREEEARWTESHPTFLENYRDKNASKVDETKCSEQDACEMRD